TDIARYRNNSEPFAVINNWMRSRATIEFIGLWEHLSHPNFKPLEFERFKNEAGSNYFVLSPQRWIGSLNARGIVRVNTSSPHGGTFVLSPTRISHGDIHQDESVSDFLASRVLVFLISPSAKRAFIGLSLETNRDTPI